MKLGPKLTLLFLVLSLIPLIILGISAYQNAHRALERDTFKHLSSVTLLKEAELNRWIDGDRSTLRELAQRPLVREYAQELITFEKNSPQYYTAYRQLRGDHLGPILAEQSGFLSLSILHPETGLVLVSTDPQFEGKYQALEDFFVEGHHATYVQPVAYSTLFQQPVLPISTPVLDRAGKLVAVLVGYTNLDEMDAIMQQGIDLSSSEKAYLLHPTHYLVTRSHFDPDLAWQKTVNAEGIANCLERTDGQGIYPDYRGVTVLGVYRWLPAHQLCIMTEVDQQEAFAPAENLRVTIFQIGGGAVSFIVVAGITFAQTIRRPIRQLVTGATEIGQGNFAFHVNLDRSDELGQLAAAFNQMAKDLDRLHREQRELNASLEQRVEERTRELDQSERLFRSYFELSASGKAITSPQREWLRVNPRLCEMLGYTQDELLAIPWDQLTHPADLDANLREFQRVLAGEIDRYNMDKRFIRKDGQIVHVHMGVACARKPDGRVDYFVTSLQDITERVHMHQELIRSNEELQRFAYVASHDLQEPLRMITSYLQLLERRYKGRLDQDADEFIAYAVDGAARMRRLIQDLLEYSRVGTRGAPFQPTACEAVLDTVCATLRLTIEEHEAVITHDDSLPVVLADPAQLEQLFQNLIANALKFRGEQPPAIHVGAALHNHEWVFSVHDNGIGIEPDYFERIFVIFQRLHGKKTYPGTGIGLALCKKIVERHGGRIWVESQPGQGSTFYFTLPASEKNEP
jgi:PAS domain S-box-containing protein